MKHSDLLITVASWEERFSLGFESLVPAVQPKKVILFFGSEYSGWTDESRVRAKALCKKEGCEIEERCLRFDRPGETWRTIFECIGPSREIEDHVTVDISTMPREIGWIIFDILSDSTDTIQYVYHEPREYAEWLTRNPLQPRLVMKLSGLMRPDLPTLLLATTGYDAERIRQLRRHFDPVLTILGCQEGTQLNNPHQNINAPKAGLGDASDVVEFAINAYSPDHGYRVIREVIEPHLGEYNIVMSSLGPKLSALSLFRLQREVDSVALAYTPSKEYNRDYSTGIGKRHIGQLNLLTGEVSLQELGTLSETTM